MASINTLYDIQTPVEDAAKAILTYNGLKNIFTSRGTGSKDTVPYVSIEAGSFIPNSHVHLSGSYFYHDIFNGSMEVLVITERKLTPASHSVYVGKVMNYMMANDLFNTQSAMPNHYMIRSTISGVQTSTDEERFLDGTKVSFNLTVAVRPDVWPN